ncbi:AAEL013215-PA, partial [Aedes aegypti]
RHNLLALHNLRLTLVLASILVGICEVAQHSVIIHHLGQLEAEPSNGGGHIPRPNEDAGGQGGLEDGLPEAESNKNAHHEELNYGVSMETAVMGLCSFCLGMVSIIVGAVFVRVVELKDEYGLLYITMTVQGAQCIVKWCQFEYIYGVTDSVTALSTSLTLGSSLVLAALAIADGVTLYQERNSSGRRHISLIMSKDTATAPMTGKGHKSSSVPFLSRITFWWITPLLWRGFVEPLELENLGKLPDGDTSRFHYDQFLSIYQRFKTSTHALWRCYVFNCWQMFLAGGVFKLLGDLCALVGPLCISNIVDYIAKPVTSSSLTLTVGRGGGEGPGNGVIPKDDSSLPAEFNLGNQSLLTDGTTILGEKVQLGPLTWSELLANGWFVAVVVLVASLAQGTFSQASTHIMDMEGIKLKNALQGLVYRKTLLLSTSCFYSDGARESRKVSDQNTADDGKVASNTNKGEIDDSTSGGSQQATTDAGTITNLMSDDAFNVMAFVKIAHYVWAIPLKIGVVMYLLYRLLGVSTIIGSFVCIITMTPLQFVIGKYMSANSKKTSECTDERLRRINEVLLGIKLIKLSAWEGVFREKISKARRKELKHLDWDSCYWTMMMLLTHISSVLITFVTVAVFIHLEHGGSSAESSAGDGRIEFTAARLFASLALFNQLTVPLFIFPITIPIILSAVVSTGRLEVFLRRPEVRTMVARPSGRPSLDVVRRESSGMRNLNRRGKQPLLGKVAVIRDREDNGKTAFRYTGVPSARRSENSQTIIDDTDDRSEMNRRMNSQTKVPRTNKSQLFTCPRLREKRLRRKSHHAELTRNDDERYEPVPKNDDGAEEPNNCAPVVIVRDGRFQWGCNNDRSENSQNSGSVLVVNQLSIPKGKLTVVVGRSGSGKSSLLAALLREINHLSGEVIWSQYSTIAYVPQRPWLLNANVRENILFGEPFRPKRYNRVLKVCALKPDIELMPDGDMSEIGERGIKLSGGQRQRIVIARALYSPASVVIMDDPLSSLDNEVAKFVFDHGIRRMLTRQRRTVVMVTQMLQLVYSADNIIAVEAFAVEATGTLSEIENNYSHILQKWDAIIAKEQQSKETQLSPGRTARERWKLFKNVSRISFLRSHATEEHLDAAKWLSFIQNSDKISKCLKVSKIANFCILISFNFNISCVGASLAESSSSLFGSRFHTHDLPLPIDECCHGENVQLRRHYSKRKPKPNNLLKYLLFLANFRKFSSTTSYSNNIVRSRSLQTKRGIYSPNHTVDGRLLPACSAHPPQSPTELDHPSPSEPTSAVAASDKLGYERFRYSDTCEDLHKFGFRQFLRRMSTIGPNKNEQNHSQYKRLRNLVAHLINVAKVYYVSSTLCGNSSCKQLWSKLKILNITKTTESDPQYSNSEEEINNFFASNFSNDSSHVHLLSSNSNELNNGEQVSNRLIYDEERKYGKIPARIYWLYLKSCGMDIVTTFFLSALAQQGLRVYTDFWLQSWTERTQQQSFDTNRVEPAEVDYNFRVYAVLSVICILLSVVCFPAGQKAGSNARRRLHQQLIGAVLKNPIHFFQTVPLGRIMNRLSIDVSVVDKKIAATSQKLLQFILLCLCAVLINSVVTPYFILLTIPICGIYYVVQKFYRCSSRELQRIESITYSPIISHFSETIDGVTTIRAYQQESRFTDTLFRRMEANNVAQVILNCSNRWLGIALDYLGALIVFIAILSALITASLSPESTSSSLIGLAINYALLVPIYLNWVVKLAAEMEMYIGAVERIQFYIESSQERIREKSKRKYKPVPISWPQKGDIVFENVSLRYESQKDNVITNLNLTIPAGQRIGICGRTGSGKSSLALALFGVLEIVGGRILIDDVDIGTIHSDELRCRLSIIPQDAMLFGGTLRENLDPRGHFSDLDLWNSLEMAQLKDVVVALPDGLDTRLGEESSTFSAGQRQLFCLARSVLRGSVCLVLDEATSSLDTETEKLVLDAAGKAFKGRTVLTIAHRLHSLFDYDRVIVLKHGRIIEDGCPRILRRKVDSKFATMLKASSTENRKQPLLPKPEQKRQHKSFISEKEETQCDEGETSV